MIPLTKDLKVRLLKAIKNSEFDGSQFPELTTELNQIQIELIDKSEDVDRDLYPDGQNRNDLLIKN